MRLALNIDLVGDSILEPTSTAQTRSANPFGRLLLLAALAIGIQGYHLGADDAAIYVPGIKQAADPTLYPFGGEFFQSHAHLTLFPWIVGLSARLTHIPVDWAIFAAYALGTFLLALGGWRLMCACFESERARWGGVVLLMGVLAVPVAGTALPIMDPYVTSRTLSTPMTILAIAAFLSGQRKQALGWWILTALIHPQMSMYVAVFLGFLVLRENRFASRVWGSHPTGLLLFAGLPFLWPLQPAQGPAADVLHAHTYFFISKWEWYEWVGIAAPLAILWAWSNASPRGATASFRVLTRTMVPFVALFTVGAIVLVLDPHLENYTRLQPMRALHLVYVIFFLLLGGLLGEYVLGWHLWRWLALFIPLGVSMYLLQVSTFEHSDHVEWPTVSAANTNSWVSAFLWVRANTPKDAVFALDPEYLLRPGEDLHGFRAIAERSVLADALKDNGAVSLFPNLAEHWKAQVDSTRGWRKYQAADFNRLSYDFPVTWLVIESPVPFGVICPYQNNAVSVCKMPVARSH
ncbi:MAG: hypothetical protein ABI824_09135 [Acidobacteriota bacterium]